MKERLLTKPPLAGLFIGGSITSFVLPAISVKADTLFVPDQNESARFADDNSTTNGR